jgi:hypothetical protein
VILQATTLRIALIDYRAELLRLINRYPAVYKENDQVIDEIDKILLSLAGNITTVNITPATCNPNV